jgi:hypothetical protein
MNEATQKEQVSQQDVAFPELCKSILGVAT